MLRLTYSTFPAASLCRDKMNLDMRREWSGWIKGRQWGELEKLAKTDPSQALTDTVAELELGFPDKPDRRALRKVLFLLSQAGFTPTEFDSHPGPVVDTPPALKAAFMVSPDAGGDRVITYGLESRGRVAWLIAHFTSRDGITKAIEDTTTVDESHIRVMRLRKLEPAPGISSEVPVEYALERLAQAVSITKSMPPVMAYWRASLPKEYAATHPADSLPRSLESSLDLRHVISTIRPAAPWRLELGSLSGALEAFLEEHAKTLTAEQSNDIEWWNVVLRPHREVLFTPEVIEDHRGRLLDVAYLMQLKGEAQVAEVLAVADDLQANGPDSAYAQWITSKTLLLLFDTLSREEAKGRSASPQGIRAQDRS